MVHSNISQIRLTSIVDILSLNDLQEYDEIPYNTAPLIEIDSFCPSCMKAKVYSLSATSRTSLLLLRKMRPQERSPLPLGDELCRV